MPIKPCRPSSVHKLTAVLAISAALLSSCGSGETSQPPSGVQTSSPSAPSPTSKASPSPSSTTQASSPDSLWKFEVSAAAAVLSRESDYVVSVAAIGPDAIVSGGFSESAKFGDDVLTSEGGMDGFVARVRSDGSYAWIYRIGGSSDDMVSAATVAPDGSIFVTGYFRVSMVLGSTTLNAKGSGDGFIASFTDSGALRWAKSFGGPGDEEPRSIAVSDSTISVAGSFSKTVSLGSLSTTSAGGLDVLLAGFTLSGDPAWLLSAGGSSDDAALDLVRIGDKFYTSGSFESSARFGSLSSRSLGESDAFVAAFTPAGWDWVATAGGAGEDLAAAVALGPEGFLSVGGSFTGSTSFGSVPLQSVEGSRDLYVASISTSGSWGKVIPGGGAGADSVRDLAWSGSELYAVGVIEEPAVFGSLQVADNGNKFNALVASIKDMDWESVYSFGSTSADAALAVSVLPTGFVFAGSMSSPTKLQSPTGTLSGVGKSDGYVVFAS